MTKSADRFQRRRLLLSVVFACMLALVGPVSAQVGEATIFGQVTDGSGAVLPGVTVTVTSPALLQQRVEVSDARGEYRVTPLPLGLYTVEYTLAGFQTLRREGIRLTAGFVARVDIALMIGGVAESVTVSGVSPVVDVRTTSAGTQLTREVLETIPSNRNSLNSLLTLAAGTRPPLESGFVGGTDPQLSSFGRRAEGWIQVEGVATTSIQANPASWNRLDYDLFEEATIQTLGAAAEGVTSGVQINVIVKSGGNDFHGSGRASYTAPGWMQGNNINDRLRAQGITAPATFDKRWDTRFELGGRLLRDRVWFYGSARKRVDEGPIEGGFMPDGSPSLASTDQRFYAGKVTAQLTSSQKVIGSYLWQGNQRAQGHDSLGSPEEYWEHLFNNYVAKGEWQIAKGNKFLSVVGGRFFAPGDNRFEGTDIAQWEDEVTGRHGGIEDRGAQLTDNGRESAKATLNWYKPDTWRGNHDFKVGGEWTRGYRQQNNYDRRAGNYVLRYRSGVPFQVRVKNNPLNPDGYIDYAGLYGQDSWSINRRVTLNLGLRYANDVAFLPAQCREAATAPFASVFPAECWPESDAQTWNSLAPRLHAAYDVTGDGKTIIKGGWARFWVLNNLGDLDARNPNAPISTTFLWRDLNSNSRFDAGESNLALNGPDFVSTAQSGNANLANLIDNPDLKEPGSDEFSLSLERELMANLGLRVTALYSKNFNSLRILNTLRPYEVYNIPINNPDPGIDNVLGTADDPGTILTYWDYPASLAGAAFQRPMFINHDGSNASYKSIEVAAIRRLSNRWQFNLVYTATKKQNVGLAYALQTGGALDPNYEINKADNTWEWLTRAMGTYLLPGDIQVAGNLSYQSGDIWGRTVAVRGGRTVPSLVMTVEPLGTRRTDNSVFVSMHASKVLRLHQGHQLKIGTNIINLLNGNYVTLANTGLPNINARSGPQFGFISGGAFGVGNTLARPRIGEIEISYSF